MAPRAFGRGWPKIGLPAYRAGHSAWWAISLYSAQRCGCVAGVMASKDPKKRSARRSDRDPRSGGTTR